MQAHRDEEDEDYNSAEDEDFDPERAAADDNVESTDDETSTAQSRGKHSAANDTEDLDFDNSGDEATVRRAHRSKKRKVHDDNDGGEGGLIKTRAQRLVETKERKPLINVATSTVNVDDLWAKMSTDPSPPNRTLANTAKAVEGPDNTSEAVEATAVLPDGEDSQNPHTLGTLAGPVTVTIKRTYEFAGRLEVEERTVPADSAEAKLFLAERTRKEEEQAKAVAPAAQKAGLRKPMKRKSMFGVASAGTGDGNPSSQGPRLNTLQKSKLDWAQQVDKEGIADELNEHSRAKDSYSSRMDFLGRMDAKREEGSRAARLP